MDGLIAPQNLIKEVKHESVISLPGFYKPLIFDILTVAAAIAVSAFYKFYLAGATTPFIFGAIAAAFFACSALQVIFTRSFGRRFAVLVLESIGLVSFFYGLKIPLLLISAGIALVFLLWGDMAARAEYENGVRIKFTRIARTAFTKITTGIVLLFILLYLPQWNPNNVFISQGQFDSLFAPVANAAKTFFPQYDFSGSVSALITSVTKAELAGNGDFQKLPEADQNSLVAKNADAALKSYNETASIKITPEEPAADAAYGFIMDRLGKWHVQFGDAFVALWAIAAFLALRALATFFWWIALVATFLVYEVLISFDFIHIAGENTTREVVEF